MEGFQWYGGRREKQSFGKTEVVLSLLWKYFTKHTACNCPKRSTCKICLRKHPTGSHGFQYKKEDGTTKDNSQDQQKSVTSNCTNVDEIQCESIGTEDILSMCAVPVKVHHNQSDKEIITFVMLDTCSQGTFVTQSFMEQLSIKGIPTSLKIKTLIGHQTESPVSKSFVSIVGSISKWTTKMDKITRSNFLKRRSL